MASSFRNFFYQANASTPTSTSTTIQPIGSSSTAGALRILTHPNSSLLPPVVYRRNPPRTLNLDLIPQLHPRVSVVKALTGSQAVRFEETLDDIIITEIWPGSNRIASMTAAQLRQLKQYFDNVPTTSDTPQFIQWEPRDQSDRAYLIEIVDLTVGGTSDYDILDIVSRGGPKDGVRILAGTDDLNVLPTGLIDREVKLSFLINSEVI